MMVVIAFWLVLYLLVIQFTSIDSLQPYQEVQKWLVGSFSNARQAERAARANKPTAALGGHELVSCTIDRHPVDSDVLIAQFRYGTDASVLPYRYRFYVFPPLEQFGEKDVRMHLYKPSQQALQLLQQNNYQVEKYVPRLSECEALRGCEVSWSAKTTLLGVRLYRGHLVQGEVRLPSQSNPNEEIVVRDDLWLWPGEFRTNDQVSDSRGKRLFGNPNNEPYRFIKHSSPHR